VTRPHHSPQRELAGIACLLSAAACFAAMDTTVRWVSVSVPLLVALWFRYLFQAVFTTAFFWPQQRARLFRTQQSRLHLLRGLLLLATSGFAFFSLKYLPVGEFTAIVMMTPIVMTLYATHQLGERVSPLRWVLVLGGFAGVLVIVRPGHESFSWAWLLPLGAVAAYTWFQLLTSRMARSEDASTLHVYTGWVGTLCCTAILPWAWSPIARTQDWLWMAAIGALGTLGHFLLIMAHARASAAVLSPYLYLQIGFAMLGGWVAFAHVPDAWAFAGMLIIGLCGAAGVWLAFHEKPKSAPGAVQ
jgi:drug/metabolite transporter (DMT)-like permease